MLTKLTAVRVKAVRKSTSRYRCTQGGGSRGATSYYISMNLKKNFFGCAPFRYRYFSFFSIGEWTRIGYFNRPGMALTPFPSSVG